MSVGRRKKYAIVLKKYGINVAMKKSKPVFDYIKNNKTEEIPKRKKGEFIEYSAKFVKWLM